MANSSDSRKKKITEYYEKNLGKGLCNYEIYDWESQEAQEGRFSVLVDYLPHEGISILDVGCGMGDLHGYLSTHGVTAEYTGVDISGKLIEEGTRKCPDLELVATDIFSNDTAINGRLFDVVYCSGVFNLNLGNNYEFLSKAMDVFNRFSTRFVVFNLLSSQTPEKHDQRYFYYDKSRVDEILKKYNYSGVAYIEDSCLFDFTVICTK